MLAHKVFRWANLIRLLFFRSFTLGEHDTPLQARQSLLHRSCPRRRKIDGDSRSLLCSFRGPSSLEVGRRRGAAGTVKNFVPYHQEWKRVHSRRVHHAPIKRTVKIANADFRVGLDSLFQGVDVRACPAPEFNPQILLVQSPSHDRQRVYP